MRFVGMPCHGCRICDNHAKKSVEGDREINLQDLHLQRRIQNGDKRKETSHM